jgi:hypothetical protein
MSSDREANTEIGAAEDLTDPATLVSTMASAVERLRHMAATVLGPDAALYDTMHDGRS